MWANTKLAAQLNIQYPLIQAPMAGATSAALVAAVSNAGGLGSFGSALQTPDQIRQTIQEIRALTDKPFAINLFAPQKNSTPNADHITQIKAILSPYYQLLNTEQPETSAPKNYTFHDQLAVILEEKIPVFSFTFGLLPVETIQQIKSQNIFVIGTATTTREAKRLAEIGVDALVAQGSEAGGHRGSAEDTVIKDAQIGSMALIPQVVDTVDIPVIASGGIMDGRGVIAALTLGAQAVQMGTAFLTCPEAVIHPKHREALLQSHDESTRLTRAFTGRFARSIKNKFLLEMEQHEEILPDFSTQSGLTKNLRQAAAQQNDTDFMSLWSGQAAALCQAIPAAELITSVIQQADKISK